MGPKWRFITWFSKFKSIMLTVALFDIKIAFCVLFWQYIALWVHYVAYTTPFHIRCNQFINPFYVTF